VLKGDSPSSRRGLYVALAVLPLLVAAALWLPRWWEMRLYRQSEEIAGVEARIVPGALAEARSKTETGMKAEAVVAAVGKPSILVGTEGKDSRREIWTYYFADGTMVVNLTDGVVQRVSADFHPPRIPTSARPR
jgi:hypothetical protein